MAADDYHSRHWKTFVQAALNDEEPNMTPLYTYLKREHFPIMYRILRCKETAQDILHDWLIKLLQSLEKGQRIERRKLRQTLKFSDQGIKNWIRKALWLQTQSYFRKNEYKHWVDTEVLAYSQCHNQQPVGEIRFDLGIAKECLAQMENETERKLVEYAIEGYKNEEIAALLNLPLRKVSYLKSRARAKFIESLNALGINEHYYE